MTGLIFTQIQYPPIILGLEPHAPPMLKTPAFFLSFAGVLRRVRRVAKDSLWRVPQQGAPLHQLPTRGRQAAGVRRRQARRRSLSFSITRSMFYKGLSDFLCQLVLKIPSNLDIHWPFLGP